MNNPISIDLIIITNNPNSFQNKSNSFLNNFSLDNFKPESNQNLAVSNSN